MGRRMASIERGTVVLQLSLTDCSVHISRPGKHMLHRSLFATVVRRPPFVATQLRRYARKEWLKPLTGIGSNVDDSEDWGTLRDFVDSAYVLLKAGDGGSGLAHLKREKYRPRGGPDGGDGGKGGNVILRTSPHFDDLYGVQTLYEAENGQRGGTEKRNGRKGKDVIIDVPVGTLVLDADSEELIVDMSSKDMQIDICRGGTGGQGNMHYVSSTNQAPRDYTKGTRGQSKEVVLEVKSVADVGLAGYPNAGKSSLLRALTRAKPRTASFPFTTVRPHVGVVMFPDNRFTIADIPGLVHGAHEGRGLGHSFLKHIERTHVIAYVVDITGHNYEHDIYSAKTTKASGTGKPEPQLEVPPADLIRFLRNELKSYNDELEGRPSLVIANKTELVADAEERLQAIREAVPSNWPVVGVSAYTGDGLETLRDVLNDMVLAHRGPYED